MRSKMRNQLQFVKNIVIPILFRVATLWWRKAKDSENRSVALFWGIGIIIKKRRDTNILLE